MEDVRRQGRGAGAGEIDGVEVSTLECHGFYHK